tara:strand:- start:488 stop:925 length:438 start_codon:yes stop_codon:yes gene_type:complete
MFATYDFTKYHSHKIVTVNFSPNIENDKDFQDFLNKWSYLYELKNYFTFIFNCENVGYVPIKYAIKMSLFIKSLKKKDIQYLEKSIIYIPNTKAKKLLDFIFTIQPPVAPVYIINNLILTENILNNDIPENIEIIYPKKSFLNLF